MKESNILKFLEVVAPILPAPLYWLDKASCVLGINKAMLDAVGAPSYNFCIGKSAFDVYPKDMAEVIIDHNNHVISRGETLAQEEKILNITTGKMQYFAAVKSPLYNDEGDIVGLIGTSIDITAEREAQYNLAEEQAIFHKLVGQMIHDV